MTTYSVFKHIASVYQVAMMSLKTQRDHMSDLQGHLPNTGHAHG